MMFNCPVCGRLKCSYWPEHWVFRRGDTFYCSETCYCIDLFRDMNLIKQVELERRQRKVGKLTLEIKKKAVQTAIDGGDPIKYLADCGYTAPDKMWCYIKAQLKEKDPETFAKIPDRRKVKKVEVPEPVNGGEWEKVETPEKKPDLVIPADVVKGPIKPDELYETIVDAVKLPKMPAPFKYRVTGIQTEVGEFWVVREGKIKWVPGRLAKEDPVMQVMWPEAEPALVPEMWRRFAEIILDVLDLLEVEL